MTKIKQLEWKKVYGSRAMTSLYCEAYIEDILLFRIYRRGKSSYRLHSLLDDNLREESSDHKILQNKAQKIFESFVRSAVV